jgi:hypothetical protein
VNLNVNELIDKLDISYIIYIIIGIIINLNVLYFSSDEFLNQMRLDSFVSKFKLYIPITTLVTDLILILIIVHKLIQYIFKNYKITKVI